MKISNFHFWSFSGDFEHQINLFWVHLCIKLPIWAKVSHANVQKPHVPHRIMYNILNLEKMKLMTHLLDQYWGKF